MFFSSEFFWLCKIITLFCSSGKSFSSFIWVRVSWPRLREDQLQALAWKVLVPLALAQLALTSVVVVVMA